MQDWEIDSDVQAAGHEAALFHKMSKNIQPTFDADNNNNNDTLFLQREILTMFLKGVNKMYYYSI